MELHSTLHCTGSELEGFKVLIFVAHMATKCALTNLIYPVGLQGQILIYLFHNKGIRHGQQNVYTTCCSDFISEKVFRSTSPTFKHGKTT